MQKDGRLGSACMCARGLLTSPLAILQLTKRKTEQFDEFELCLHFKSQIIERNNTAPQKAQVSMPCAVQDLPQAHLTYSLEAL